MTNAKTLPSALREQARARPEEPWLFHRPSWVWQWRSYVQVADQVARAAEALREAGVAERVACPPLVEPDAVAEALAVQAAGSVAAAGPGAAFAVLPPAHRRIDAWTPRTIDDRSNPAGPAFAGDDGRLVSHEDLLRSAESWRLRLPSDERRHIVATSPRLGPALRHELMAFTLASNAAWALEHDPDAFVAAVEWCRPTVAAVTPAEAEELATALGERRHRRWSRLRLLVVEGGAAEDVGRDLGVEVLSFPLE